MPHFDVNVSLLLHNPAGVRSGHMRESIDTQDDLKDGMQRLELALKGLEEGDDRYRHAVHAEARSVTATFADISVYDKAVDARHGDVTALLDRAAAALAKNPDELSEQADVYAEEIRGFSAEKIAQLLADI